MEACGSVASTVPSEERAAMMRIDHRRMLQQMMQRVASMRTAQTESAVLTTSPDRLDALENHLRFASACCIAADIDEASCLDAQSDRLKRALATWEAICNDFSNGILAICCLVQEHAGTVAQCAIEGLLPSTGELQREALRLSTFDSSAALLDFVMWFCSIANTVLVLYPFLQQLLPVPGSLVPL